MNNDCQIIFPPGPITKKLVNSVNALLGINLDYAEITRRDPDCISKTREAIRKFRLERDNV